MKYLLAGLLLICNALAHAAEAEVLPLHPKLEPLRPYLNRYWQGDLTQPGKTEKVIDRSTWSRALNGQAIKTVHSINDGEYGGESFIFWDEKKQSLAYYYFTTAGFYTHGTMEFNVQSGEIVALENVENNQNGVTQVKSYSRILPDGRLQTKSSYLQNDNWVEGHSATYQQVAAQPIRFR